MRLCAYCGENPVKPRSDRTPLFCSIGCSNKSRKVSHTRICHYCGDLFTLQSIAYERRGYGKYCSRSCSSEALRKYTFNRQYFENIETEEQAYWLGFLFADGGVTKYEVRFELKESDSRCVTKFKAALDADQPLYGAGTGFVGLRLSSVHFSNSLISHGCVPRKSKIIRFPASVPPQLSRHFIRGFFDGDGCISGPKGWGWSIYSSSRGFIQDLVSIVRAQGLSVTSDTTEVRTSRRLNLIRMYEYLYLDSTVFLERKHTKFKEGYDTLFARVRKDGSAIPIRPHTLRGL